MKSGAAGHKDKAGTSVTRAIAESTAATDPLFMKNLLQRRQAQAGGWRSHPLPFAPPALRLCVVKAYAMLGVATSVRLAVFETVGTVVPTEWPYEVLKRNASSSLLRPRSLRLLLLPRPQTTLGTSHFHFL